MQLTLRSDGKSFFLTEPKMKKFRIEPIYEHTGNLRINLVSKLCNFYKCTTIIIAVRYLGLNISIYITIIKELIFTPKFLKLVPMVSVAKTH
jgi:hypothetical protein